MLCSNTKQKPYKNTELNWLHMSQVPEPAWGREGKERTRSVPFSIINLLCKSAKTILLHLWVQLEIMAPIFWTSSPTAAYLGQIHKQEVPIFQLWLRNCLHDMSFIWDDRNFTKTADFINWHFLTIISRTT